MARFSQLFIAGLWLCATSTLVAQPSGCHLADTHPESQVPDLVSRARLRAAVERSDSVDILHYEIWLDVTKFSGTLSARTDVTLTPKIPGQNKLVFDFTTLSMDSIRLGGSVLSFTYPDPFLLIDLPDTLGLSDTITLSFYYHGSPHTDPSWGGFYFENGYAYNLGIGITSNPPNFGRVWYPCFDNFVERATYDIHVLSSSGRRGYAIGDFISETVAGQDSVWRHYRMDQLLPTYLTNVAVSNYVAFRDTHQGAFGAIPIELLAKPADIGDMITGFSRLGDALDAIESWYGPYPWSRVGYVITTRGAMEHPTNTAFPENSLNNGAGDLRLMTHELGHHWWGNVTTLREPTDMWIKEGNAEYCAHLIDEWSDGRDAFINTVKSNQQEVLVRAHQDDGDFLPLSGLPFKNIYGTHSYKKGASVMHNLRGYLGDSLYRVGQQSILDTYAYNAVDAETYRDQISMATGKDMTSFFEDWIFQPGFSAFKIHSLEVSPDVNGFALDLVLEQGLRAAPAFHQDVPLEITVYGADWSVYRETVMAGGQYSAHSLVVPFEPAHVSVNERDQLNQARLDYQQVIRQPGTFLYPFVHFRTVAETVPDSALVRVDHMWVAPEQPDDQPDLHISSTNYWIISGIFPSGFKAQGRFSYDATSVNAFLDQDIAKPLEDSLILLYRPDATHAWAEHPDYKLITLLKTDGKGDVVAENLAPGEYALARGMFLQTAVQDPDPGTLIRVFPNPTNGPVWVTWPESLGTPGMVRWVSPMGLEISSSTVSEVHGEWLEIQTAGLPAGLNFLQILDRTGRMLTSRPVVVRPR